MLNPNDAQSLVLLLQLSALASNAGAEELQRELNVEALKFYQEHSDRVIVEPKIVHIQDAQFEK